MLVLLVGGVKRELIKAVSGTDKDGESDRADWVDSLRYPAEIDLVVDVTRRSLVIKLK